MPYDKAGSWTASEPDEFPESLERDTNNAGAIDWIKAHRLLPVCLIGTIGTGKSTLLAWAYDKLTNAFWTDADSLCEDVRKAIGRTHIEIDALEFAKSPRCEYLFLDDLGAERDTEHNLDVVSSVLTARFNRGMATWISSNLDLDAIGKRYSPRIADRILAKCKVFTLKGDSRRKPFEEPIVEGFNEPEAS